MFGNNDFTEYMGYRNLIIENKIEECLEAARRGETSVTVDRDDITDDEMAYIQKELDRRIQSGRY